MKFNKLSTEWLLILALAGVKLAVHFMTNTNYGLHRDEYLYLALGDHPDWGYVSVPPVIGVLAGVVTAVLGDSVFAVRLLPALAGTVSIILIGLIVLEMGGRKPAILLAGAAFLLSPSFLRSNTLFMPVSFNQLSWLLSAYFLVKLVKSKDSRYWIVLGLIWGLAFLNKYSIVFFAAASLMAVVLTEDRRLFRSSNFVYGFAAGLLIILPNLIWQHQHNWPVVSHMAELQRTQLVNVRLSDFMGLQFLMNLHAVPLWLGGLVLLLFLPAGKPFRVIGLTFVLVVLMLAALSGKAYYTLGAYSMLFAAGGVAFEKYATQRWRMLQLAVLVLMAAIAIPVIPYGLPVLQVERMLEYAERSKRYGLEGALRWEDGRVHQLPQDYADMVGWDELGEIVVKAYQSLADQERSNCTIYGDNYGHAGAIRYFGQRQGLPAPVSFNETFVLWSPASVESLSTLIYVNDELGQDIQYFFDDIILAGRVEDPYFRENGLQVYVCRKPNDEFAAFYRDKAARLRNHYR